MRRLCGDKDTLKAELKTTLYVMLLVLLFFGLESPRSSTCVRWGSTVRELIPAIKSSVFAICSLDRVERTWRESCRTFFKAVDLSLVSASATSFLVLAEC
jgi:hypothetical protein